MPADAPNGATLAGRYALDRQIGWGAVARVYLARTLDTERRVAVKVLRPELSRDSDTRHFLREIARTMQLDHANIVRVLDSGDAAGRLFYVMPFMEGGTLRDRLSAAGAIAVPETVAIARAIAGALHHAHGRGLVHRDVKPENILFTAGQPCLADFGIARALDRVPAETWSSIGLIRGTPPYMSPEQARAAADLDARTDVYSLACVLYEMLAGHPPFGGRTPHAVLRRHLQDPPPPLHAVRADVHPALEHAILRALAKDPAERPATARAFAVEMAADQ